MRSLPSQHAGSESDILLCQTAKPNEANSTNSKQCYGYVSSILGLVIRVDSLMSSDGGNFFFNIASNFAGLSFIPSGLNKYLAKTNHVIRMETQKSTHPIAEALMQPAWSSTSSSIELLARDVILFLVLACSVIV